MKKKMIIFTVLVFSCILFFEYQTEYKVHRVDVNKSPNGIYRLELQQIGDPEWPFGATNGRIILKKGHTILHKETVSVNDDGANLGKSNWSVVWDANFTTVTLKGSEQEPCEITIQYS